MRKLALLLLLAGSAVAQVPAYPSRVNVFVPKQKFETSLDLRCVVMSSQPLSAAGRTSIGCDSTSGALQASINGGAFAAIGGGGSGTVTSVGNGTISALFSASWATATSTPALSLSFASQSGRKFFASPADGSSGAITARAIVAADVPVLDPTGITGTAVITTDSRLSDARTPNAHATSHKNGGSDEVATATAAANAIPKAGSGGTLSSAWIPTLNQNTTGTASAFAANGTNCTGTQKAAGIDASGNAEGCTAIAYADVTGTPSLATVATSGSATDLSAGTLAAARMPALTGAVTSSAGSVATTLATVAVASGGTGLTTLTANNVILGNGTSAPAFVAPSTSGNVLTSNGTTWTSAAASGGVTCSGCTTSTIPVTSGAGTQADSGISETSALTSGVVKINGQVSIPETNKSCSGTFSVDIRPAAQANNTGLCWNNTYGMGLGSFGSFQFALNGNVIQMPSNAVLALANTTTPFAPVDTGLSKGSAGTWLFGNGTPGDFSGGGKGRTFQIAGPHGQLLTYGPPLDEYVTVSLLGLTSVSLTNLAAASSTIDSITYLITSSVTGPMTSFNVRVTGGNAFCTQGTATTAQSTFTAGTTGNLVPCAFADQYNPTANTLTVTFNGIPTGGIIELSVAAHSTTPPSS